MRKILTVVSAVAAAMAGTAIVLAPAAHAAAACRVDYSLNAQWPGGFNAGVRITNLGDPVNGWTLGFAFPDAGQRVTTGWSASWSQRGQAVSASSLPWNGTLATNAATLVGFLGAWSGANPVPTAFTLNGTACTGQVPPTRPTMATSTTRPPVPDPFPVVEWLGPPDGSTFTAPADILLRASGRGSDGSPLTRGLEFLVDGVVVATSSASPPQEFLWRPASGPPGSTVTRQLSARGCTSLTCRTTTAVTITITTP